MINKAIIIGRVGQDPEFKSFDVPGKVGGSTDSREIATFSVATSESYKKRDGEKVTNTYWHKIKVTSPGLVGVVRNYVNKGSLIYIEGAIKPREWENREGVKVTIVEIEIGSCNGTLRLLDRRSEDNKSAAEQSDHSDTSTMRKTATAGNQTNMDFTSDLDDEIPF